MLRSARLILVLGSCLAVFGCSDETSAGPRDGGSPGGSGGGGAQGDASVSNGDASVANDASTGGEDASVMDAAIGGDAGQADADVSDASVMDAALEQDASIADAASEDDASIEDAALEDAALEDAALEDAAAVEDAATGEDGGDMTDAGHVRAWSTPALIENRTQSTFYPTVTLNDAGDGFAVWPYWTGTRSEMWAARYSVAGWASPVFIGTGTSGDEVEAQVAIDDAGNALAVWRKGTDDIWANRYVAGMGWAGPQEISGLAAGAGRPLIAINASGDAIVVWSRSDVWACAFDAELGWGPAEKIAESGSNTPNFPNVAMNDAGQAVVLWLEHPTYPINDLWSVRFDEGVWGDRELVETSTNEPHSHFVALDELGNAVATWRQGDGVHNDIYSNQAAAGMPWGTASPIETNADDAFHGSAVSDGTGNVVAVWYQYDGEHYSPWTNRYTNGAWGTASLIEQDDRTEGVYTGLTTNTSGEAIAVWVRRTDGRDDIWANHYVDGAWGTRFLIETNDTGYARSPAMKLNNAGTAIIVWQQWDGTRLNIWSSALK